MRTCRERKYYSIVRLDGKDRLSAFMKTRADLLLTWFNTRPLEKGVFMLISTNQGTNNSLPELKVKVFGL